MLTVKACSETTLFAELSDEVFHSLQFGEYISYDHYLFVSKCLKFDIDSRNGKKESEKVLCFLDICI